MKTALRCCLLLVFLYPFTGGSLLSANQSLGFFYTDFFISSAHASNNSHTTNVINSVRVWPSPSNTRVVFDLEDQPEYTWFTLEKPHRLVVDLARTKGNTDFSKVVNNSKLVTKLRHSKPKNKNSVRVVLELDKKVKPQIFALQPTAPYGNRLVIDLADNRPVSNSKDIIKQPVYQRSKDIIIAIDAGHGGEDPGSIGPMGTYEKNVVLRISQKLANKINAERGMKAVMVRTGDYYIAHGRRTEIARQSKADMFISIHADAFTTPQPNGASTWVLSTGRANTELGKWLENKEQHSVLLGGAAEVIQDTNAERYLTQALLDMSMDHSIATSYDVSRSILREMKGIMKLHKKTPQAASLAVLTSPDIPSVLVETGFISNPKEEKNLNWKKHQQNLANAIFTGVKKHFQKSPPDGTLWAKNRSKSRTHRVERGDSLSELAVRYNVSVTGLKKANNLSNDMVRIGQVLQIPQS